MVLFFGLITIMPFWFYEKTATYLPLGTAYVNLPQWMVWLLVFLPHVLVSAVLASIATAIHHKRAARNAKEALSAVDEPAKRLGFPVFVLPVAAAASMESAIKFMVGRLAADGFLPPELADEVASCVLKREKLGSTALGRGFALPHTTKAELERVIGILAHCPRPVPWDAPDAQGVQTIRLGCGSRSPPWRSPPCLGAD